MTDVVQTSSSWLALREPEDARSRSMQLALAAATRLGDPPIVVHDLGSGTGSMMRWLAPLLPGPQTWVLHDWNASLVASARDERMPVDRDGRPLSVRTSVGELEHVDGDDLRGASLVTASALLDVLTSEEVHAIAAASVAAGAPVLLSLSVTGRVDLIPRHPLDEAFQNAFNAHQRRSADGRRLLGPHAVAVVRGLFLEAGWHVRPVETPWRLGPHDARLLAEWFDGWTDAALEQSPHLHDDASDYLDLRRAQLTDGALSAVVHHRDLLAWSR
ncbi:SAM-dependent methyltransferase [Humibacter sp. RRB41]|uniref:SAM-dependent methyltransferase n=1 Tax=Humibacter sp. RRB41 TaxID=2919946 RepID=UPI001FAB07D9|nr:SAM-dependent methyltransferase [Humibacter sp. RRB41]